ncbi:MAG: TetR/AcrR family transcriptional regulator [Promethearchaeota archaeon]
MKVSEIRKQEFFNAAMELVKEKGYQKITVQSVIDKLGVSKGAFYHYFNSKQDLLDIIIFHFVKNISKILEKIVEDEKLDALEKLNKLIVTAKEYKAAQKELNIEFIRQWRQGLISLNEPRIFKKYIKIIRPIWQKVIDQGVKEGIFNIPYPNEITDLIIHISNYFNTSLAKLVIDIGKKPEFIKIIQRKVSLFEDVFERLLGVEKGSIDIIGPYMRNVTFYRKIIEENNLSKEI